MILDAFRADSSIEGPDALTVTLKELDSTVLLRVDGELDLATVDQMVAIVDAVDLDGITLLVLDVQDVDFLDLTALRVIFQLRDRCEADGVHFTVIGPGGAARRVFVLTRAFEVLEVVDAGAGPGR